MDIHQPTTVRLYSPKQIGVAAFVGSPVAAGWFFWCNEQTLGRPGTGARWFWWMLVVTVAVVALSFVLPAKFPPFIIPLAYTLALRNTAKNLYEAPFAGFLAQGGVQGSWWNVMGIGFLALFMVLALVFGVVLLLPTRSE